MLGLRKRWFPLKISPNDFLVCREEKPRFEMNTENKWCADLRIFKLLSPTLRTIWSKCNLCRNAHFVTMATVVSLCNYVTRWSVTVKFYHSVSFIHLKSYSKNQDPMIYNDKVFCTFVVLPAKPRFQRETWIRATENGLLTKVYRNYSFQVIKMKLSEMITLSMTYWEK